MHYIKITELFALHLCAISTHWFGDADSTGWKKVFHACYISCKLKWAIFFKLQCNSSVGSIIQFFFSFMYVICWWSTFLKPQRTLWTIRTLRKCTASTVLAKFKHYCILKNNFQSSMKQINDWALGYMVNVFLFSSSHHSSRYKKKSMQKWNIWTYFLWPNDTGHLLAQKIMNVPFFSSPNRSRHVT